MGNRERFAPLGAAALLWLCAVNQAPGQPAPASEVSRFEQAAAAAAQRQDPAGAEAQLQQALAAQEKALGPNTAELANYLDRLSELSDTAGRFREAEQYERRALGIREALLGPDSLDAARSLNILAEQEINQGHFTASEPLAERTLEIRLKLLGPDNLEVAQARNTLSEIYRNEGRLVQAEPLKRQVLATVEKSLPDSPILAIVENNLATLLCDEGKYPEAEPIYLRMLGQVERTSGSESPPYAQGLNNLAQVYFVEEKFGEAETMLQRALAIREKMLVPDHPDIIQTRTNLAVLYQDEGKFDKAEPLFESTAAAAERAFGPQDYRVAIIENGLGALYHKQQRFPLAEEAYRHAITIQESVLGNNNPNVAVSLNNLGDTYMAEHRYDDAEPYFARAVAIWQAALGPDHPNVAQGLTNLAVVHGAQHRPDEALSESNLAVGILTRHLTPAASSQATAAAREEREYRSDFLVNIGINDQVGRAAPQRQSELVAASFISAQLAQRSITGLAVATMAARASAGEANLQVMVREQQDTLALWQKLGSSLVAAVSCAPGQCDPHAAEQLRTKRSEVSEHLDRLDAEIASQFPAYTELSDPTPLSAAAAQALLATNEALLVYVVGGDETWLWAVRREGTVLYRLAIGAKALSDEVRALRLQLDPEQSKENRPFDVARSYALYQQIVEPAVSRLQGIDHVIIVPDGALQSLPLGVLVTGKVKPIEDLADYRKVPWLARDYAVSLLPAVTSLRSLRQLARSSAATRPFIGIGDPVLGNPPLCNQDVKLASLFRGATGDVDAVRQLCSLSAAGEELRALARAEGASNEDLYLAARATKPVVTALPLAHYRVIAFATHGLVAGDIKTLAEPALVLTPPAVAAADDDGLLTASDVAKLKLDADWVILSACNTAAGDVPGAEGLSGLAKAFFYAGSRSLLVSHWPVRSDAAEELTVRTLGAMRRDPTLGRSEALRRGEMALLDEGSPEMAAPIMWAPFSLVGEGSAGH